MSTVFIALQTNEDTRSIIEAILADNPHAVANEQPAMVKIDAEGRWSCARDHRRADRPRLRPAGAAHQPDHLTGNVDETDDELTLSWNA
jgi:phenol hydroxylase P2 protein